MNKNSHLIFFCATFSLSAMHEQSQPLSSEAWQEYSRPSYFLFKHGELEDLDDQMQKRANGYGKPTRREKCCLCGGCSCCIVGFCVMNQCWTPVMFLGGIVTAAASFIGWIRKGIDNSYRIDKKRGEICKLIAQCRKRSLVPSLTMLAASVVISQDLSLDEFPQEIIDRLPIQKRQGWLEYFNEE